MSQIPPTLMDPQDAALEAAQRRRNRILLIVLVAFVLLLMVASKPLFTNFHDPNISATTVSH